MSALKPCPRSIQVGEFEVAISGGVWVAIRDQDLHRTVLSRMSERANAIEVDIDAI